MKKLILSIAVLSGFAFNSQAQTEKGKFILGGAVGYHTEKSDASGSKSSHDLSIVPSVGYFIADNIAVGTGVGYNYSKTAVASPIGQNQSFVVNPFGRYYANLGEQFKFFGQLSVPMAFGTVKSVDANGDTGAKVGNSTAIGVALAPGFAFYPTKKFGIELSFSGIEYNNFRVKDSDGDKVKGAGNDSFAVGANFFSPKLGVQFHF